MMRTARLSFVGDVLIHDSVYRSAEERRDIAFRSNFRRVAGLLEGADIACANLESITAGEKFGISGYPRFNAPVDLLESIKESGFNAVNIANNHMLDKGESALLESISNISSFDLGYCGASSAEDPGDSEYIHEANGISVGFVSFTDAAKIDESKIEAMNINRFPGETSRERMSRRVNLIKKRVRLLRDDVDVVILQLHFGEEYHRFPSAFQREFVASLAETGVDAIIGHHPHVLQPSEWVENSKGKHVLVHYSLGNFLSGQGGIHRQIGGIFSFDVVKDESRSRPRVYLGAPALKLTYVDRRDGYSIRSFSDFAKERSSFHSTGFGAVDSQGVLTAVYSHARTYIQDLAVS